MRGEKPNQVIKKKIERVKKRGRNLVKIAKVKRK